MNRIVTCTLAIWFSCVVVVHAQHTAFDSFVSKISRQYKVDIAISPQLIPVVDSILNSGTPVTSIDELLQLLVKEEHMTYQIVDGNKLMLRKNDDSHLPQYIATIEGTIMDQQEKLPLPYAAVHIVNTTRGCQTDENGYFNLTVSDTTSKVEINYLGYTTIVKPISELLHGPVTINMKLHEMPLDEVMIIIPYKEVSQDPQTQSLNLIEYALISEEHLLQRNAERLIKTLTSYTQYSSDEGIRIRGVEPQNSLFLMDELPVYNPYHYYNIFSPFNTNYFSSIKLYKNNLPVEYGSRIDGMIQLASEQEKRSDHLILETDLLLSSLEGRTAIGKDFSFAVGGRISHTGILNEALRDSSVMSLKSRGKFNSPDEWTTVQQPTFNFHDINAGLEGKIGDKSKVCFNLFTSKDQLDTETASSLSTTFMNQDMVTFNQYYNSKDQWKNNGISTGFETALSNKTTMSFNAFYSHYSKEESYTSESEEERYGKKYHTTSTGFVNSELKNAGIKGTFRKEISSTSSYQAGIDLNQYNVILEAKENGSPYVNETQQEFETTLFGEYQQWLSHHFMFVLGSRMTHLNQPARSYFLPNINVSYFIGQHGNVRTAFSQSVQALHELKITNRFGREMEALALNNVGSGYPVLKSDKYMMGGGYSNSHFSLDAEVYYKKIDGLMRIASLYPDQGPNDHSSPETFYNLFTGNGWTAGMDLTAYCKIGKTDIVLSYTLSKIKEQYDELFGGDEFSPEEDRRHQLKFSGKHKFGNFDFSTLITYKSEAPYLSYVRVESNNHDHHHDHGGIEMAPPTAVFDFLPPFFSLDLAVDYNFNFFKQGAQVGISLINATDHANIDEVQHIGRVSRDENEGLYVTHRTELLGRTWNAHFKIMF